MLSQCYSFCFLGYQCPSFRKLYNLPRNIPEVSAWIFSSILYAENCYFSKWWSSGQIFFFCNLDCSTFHFSFQSCILYFSLRNCTPSVKHLCLWCTNIVKHCHVNLVRKICDITMFSDCIQQTNETAFVS